MTSRRALVAAVCVLALACVAALAGCAGGSDNPGKPAAVGNQAPAEEQGEAGTVESTAMVIYNNGGEVLFVDQDNGTLYYPTLEGNTILGANGAAISADDLAVGNIVRVTGNGIMLESYPGQYPGISEVAVIEEGSPSDADQYAELISQVVIEPDPSEVPSGYVQYATDMADTSVMLEPYTYEWVVPGDGAANNEQELDADFTDAQGTLLAGIVDARISAPVEATVGFSVAPTNVVVERTPLTSTDVPAVNPAVEDEPVPATLQSDGTAVFTMEPGYAYEIEADFAQGEASYAFYTFS